MRSDTVPRTAFNLSGSHIYQTRIRYDVHDTIDMARHSLGVYCIFLGRSHFGISQSGSAVHTRHRKPTSIVVQAETESRNEHAKVLGGVMMITRSPKPPTVLE